MTKQQLAAWEQELETMIAAIVRRKKAAGVDSAEYRFCEKQLDGLRDSYEEAGPIIEDLDWNRF